MPVDGLAGQKLERGERCFRVRREGYTLVGAQLGEALTAGLGDRVCLNLAPAEAPLRVIFHMEKSR